MKPRDSFRAVPTKGIDWFIIANKKKHCTSESNTYKSIATQGVEKFACYSGSRMINNINHQILERFWIEWWIIAINWLID